VYKYGVVTSYATSLTVVANDICEALRRLGFEAELYTQQIYHFEAIEKFNRAIVFMTFDPLYCISWFLLVRDYNVNGLPALLYVTTEGYPKREHIPNWFRRDLEFIACSNFVKEMLIDVGQNVIGVVRHGINLADIENAEVRKDHFKHLMKRRTKGKVIFGTVATSHQRKGLNYLAKAIKIIGSKEKEIVFYILTTPRGKDYFGGLKNVIVDTNFGALPRRRVLQLIGSFDYYLHPALCEGFGLPLLEANALGVPCIFPLYEPLTETVDPKLNFPFEYDYEEIRDFGDGIRYLCHMYSPETMVEKIEEAYEMFKCNEKEYKRRVMEVRASVREFDIVSTYRQFLKFFE